MLSVNSTGGENVNTLNFYDIHIELRHAVVCSVYGAQVTKRHGLPLQTARFLKVSVTHSVRVNVRNRPQSALGKGVSSYA